MFAMVLGTIAGAGAYTDAEAAEQTLLNTYGVTFKYSGTCINLYQLKDASQLAALKKNFNSITLENEMKPDSLMWGSGTLSVSQAKNQGYYIPDNYKESLVPSINFSTVDQVMKICHDNGIKMRAHTLLWHAQTPHRFFHQNYNESQGFVSKDQMDARLEMYVKTVMNHVYTSNYADVVYAWDVVNEYIHATNSDWERVYGKMGNYPSFCKKAFQFAYDPVEDTGLFCLLPGHLLG